MDFHLGTHSVEPGANWVANFFTSIVNRTEKSRKRPISRVPLPPDVSQVRWVMTADPHGSIRPRLRFLMSAPHSSAASRLHLPSGPAQWTLTTSYHQGPLGPYSAIAREGPTPPSARRSRATKLTSWVVPGTTSM